MPPAARITDMHTCPMVDPGPKPHVGGPISSGAPSVLIGGQPAARVSDMAVCAGPPDVIVRGSATVLICGQPAARLGDNTAHGGVITVGFPTVLIGDGGSGGGGGGGGGGVASATKGAMAGAPATQRASAAVQSARAGAQAGKLSSLTKWGIEKIPDGVRAARAIVGAMTHGQSGLAAGATHLLRKFSPSLNPARMAKGSLLGVAIGAGIGGAESAWRNRGVLKDSGADYAGRVAYSAGREAVSSAVTAATGAAAGAAAGVIIGGIIGGVAGAFAGGIGAVPGALGGASAGAVVGAKIGVFVGGLVPQIRATGEATVKWLDGLAGGRTQEQAEANAGQGFKNLFGKWFGKEKS